MKKSGNKKSTPNEEPSRELRWTPLFVAFRDACEWALDVAVALARGYPEEVDAVERVRGFLRARIIGESADIGVDDVMFVFGLLLAAIEKDLGPIRTRVVCIAPTFPFHFPAAPDGSPRIPRRFDVGCASAMHGELVH